MEETQDKKRSICTESYLADDHWLDIHYNRSNIIQYIRCNQCQPYSLIKNYMSNLSEFEFNLTFVPQDTPLYFILTGRNGSIKGECVLIYSSEILSIIKEYIETGVIDIVSLFNNESNSVDIDELVDAFCYLLALYKPDNFPTEY